MVGYVVMLFGIDHVWRSLTPVEIHSHQLTVPALSTVIILLCYNPTGYNSWQSQDWITVIILLCVIILLVIPRTVLMSDYQES